MSGKLITGPASAPLWACCHSGMLGEASRLQLRGSSIMVLSGQPALFTSSGMHPAYSVKLCIHT